MAPTDKLQLPFRWSFIPEQDARDGSIRAKDYALFLLDRKATSCRGTPARSA
jgi:hypothetical protein